MATPPSRPPLPPLTGAASLVQALRNLGLLGRPSAVADDSFVADDGQPVPVQWFSRHRLGGAARPVVMLHGLGCTQRHWQPVARRLARAHPVLAWCARGHGTARPVPGASITLRRLGMDLAQLIQHFQLRQPVLVGHSMGAMTVMQYLQDHGAQALAAACLVDQSPRVVTDDDWALGLWGACSAEMLRSLIHHARDDLPALVLQQARQAAGGHWWGRMLEPQHFLGRQLADWLRTREVAPLLDLCESLVAADFRPTLARLNLPLLVVLGGRSGHYQRVPLADYYRRTVPGAELRTYPASGHSPHVAEPVRFADDLLAFIETL